jgi:hypothetical protein
MKTILVAKASEQLEKEVNEELKIDDPESELALATLLDAEKKESDEPGTTPNDSKNSR